MRSHLRLQQSATILLLTLATIAHAQPTVVTEIPERSTGFITAGNHAYFTSSDSLLRTDGTEAGTIFLKSGFSSFSQFTEFNNLLFFVAGDQLWRSDGSPGGTIQLATKTDLDILSGTGSTLFFQGSDAATGQELYRTNGTTAGTALVKDINPGPGDGFLGNSAIVGANLFFRGNNGVNGDEPWKSNGTAAGTVMVEDVNPGPGSGFLDGQFDDDFVYGSPYEQGDVYSYNNQFFFTGYTPGNGQEPWVSDGTAAGTFMLKDTESGADDPAWILYGIGHDGFVYFITKSDIDSSTGEAITRLWKTSGTTASTVSVSSLIKDTSGQEDDGVTYADPFRIYNGKVYFFARNYLGPHELWVTDGTTSGTHNVYTLNNRWGDYTMIFFEVVDGYLIFYGTMDAYPTELYRSDGTTAGTRAWYNFASAGHDTYPRSVTAVGDLIFFGDHNGPSDGSGGTEDPDDYYHLFQADPSILSVASMQSLYGVNTSGTGSIENYHGKVIFWTHNFKNVPSDTPKYLWVYDPNGSGNERPGKIQQEVWSNVPGTKVSSIPLSAEPSSVKDLTIFETATNVADNYGSRVRGYVLVPQTGTYTFWIASDDQSQLWLSTDDNPANKRKIAEVTGWTTSRQWEKYTSQKSAAISLVANKKYYIEALHKEGTGGDNLAVGWQLPDGSMERPIPGNRLIPFKTTETPPEPCAGAGMIRQEFWTGVSGTRVSDIPVNEDPDFTQDLMIFEGPASPVGDNYGSRIRGYICPPASGQYIFWISGDDHVELSLSTNDNPANKRRIAYHMGWTNKREWTKYATQQSASITLQAGQRYYIEALMKEGLKADHVSVGWQHPDGTMERPIAGSHLIPFGESTPAPTACAGTGTISVETWTGIDGTRVSSIPVDSPPNLTGERNIFEAPTNVGSNFGSRFRGYVCVPATGNYTFWIASDDHGELWLSTDGDPANKRRIAYHMGWTSPRQWTKYTTQQSAPISLVAGQQYYIEALYKEDEGGDNMAVGWQLPDGTLERPIPGNRLSPFKGEQTTTMQSETTSMEATSAESDLYSRISIYPNPARSGDGELTISGYEGIERTIETQVEIINITGEVVFSESILCGGGCGSYLMNVNKQLVPGVYVVNMKTNGVRTSKRLLVK